MAWITPLVALVFGLGVVGSIVRAWRSRPLLKPADLPAPVEGPELEHFRQQARRETEV